MVKGAKSISSLLRLSIPTNGLHLLARLHLYHRSRAPRDPRHDEHTFPRLHRRPCVISTNRKRPQSFNSPLLLQRHFLQWGVASLVVISGIDQGSLEYGRVSEHKGMSQIDVSKSRYPYCVVWSPLPPITWILPFVGHTGIADSDGVIWDFAGPYTIGRDQMAFGAPTRYIKLDPRLCRDMEWDKGIEAGCEIYSRRTHNLFCDNCHNHVAKCLNLMAYGNSRNHGVISLGVQFFFFGEFTGTSGFLKTFLPTLFILAIIICPIYLTR